MGCLRLHISVKFKKLFIFIKFELNKNPSSFSIFIRISKFSKILKIKVSRILNLFLWETKNPNFKKIQKYYFLFKKINSGNLKFLRTFQNFESFNLIFPVYIYVPFLFLPIQILLPFSNIINILHFS